MARLQKRGLDYFPLDTVLDIKFDLIEAEFGLTGFAVIVKLLQKIYAEQGYYCEYTNEVALLFSKKLGFFDGGNVVSEIITASIKRGIFNAQLFNDYQILTSEGIQKRYFEAVSRRNVDVESKYLLINANFLSSNVNINSINVCNNSEIVDNNSTNKSKVNKSILNKNKKEPDVVIEYYEINIGLISTAIYTDINSYRDMGFEDDLICKCIEIAVFANKRTWLYVKGILRNLQSQDIKTLKQFNACNNKKSKSSETSSYDIDGLDEFWNTVPKLL